MSNAKEALRRAKIISNSILSDETYFKLRHFLRFRRIPNIDHPRIFTDHILSLMLHRENEHLRRLVADKWTVRQYVSDTIGTEWLAEVYQVAEHFNDLNLELINAPFAAKASHGSGMVEIVVDPSDKVRKEAVSKTAVQWLNVDYSLVAREFVYNNLTPRIIIEELLTKEDGKSVPSDFKFFMFHGRPHLIEVDLDRFGKHTQAFYSTDWLRLPIQRSYPSYSGDLPRPKNLAKMIELASQLAKPFSFVRVDLYDLGNRIVFGEMTNFPTAGGTSFRPWFWEVELGKLFDNPHTSEMPLTSSKK